MCPYCEDHNQKKERSLVITREKYNCKYYCHRASCNRQGVIPMNNEIHLLPAPPKRGDEFDRFHRARLSLMALPPDIETQLKEKYDMDTLMLARGAFKWSPSLSRVYMPIMNKERMYVGGTYRSLDPKAKTKSFTVMDKLEWPKLALYSNPVSAFRKLLIVEDQISAVAAVGQDISSAALCGCNTNIGGMRELSELKPEKVVICLDGDALNKGIELHKRYSYFFHDCKVVKPPADLKDMKRTERIAFLTKAFSND